MIYLIYLYDVNEFIYPINPTLPRSLILKTNALSSTLSLFFFFSQCLLSSIPGQKKRRITVSLHNLTHILLLLFTNTGKSPTRVHAPGLGLGAKRTGLRSLGYPVLLSPARYPLAFLVTSLSCTISLRLNSLTGQLPSDLVLCWNNLFGSMSDLSSLKNLAQFNVSNNLSMLLGLIFYKGFLLNSRDVLIWYLTKFRERVVVSEASTKEDSSGEVTNTFEVMHFLLPFWGIVVGLMYSTEKL
ncbi:hypothetical protein V6N13_142455 [Hibiscus sabdariffa]|uniref:Uncharacterized protein n=1 Tax=Hibiscus sabdariffa TaxID=183260 RepID=A0ABR2FE88_9ROSI